MRRREFITLVGGAVTALPFAVHAQQPAVPVIGLMGVDSAASQSRMTAAFVQRLGELGWTEGRNVMIEYRWAEGHTERFAAIAAEFVQRNVSIILTHNTPPTLAAKHATSVIPIVFATAGDPVETGLVSSLARPGGNLTGLSSQASDIVGKRLELLRQTVPGLRRLATISDIGNPWAAFDVSKTKDAARTLGIEVTSFEIGRAEEID
jgi:putative ABC transport system substrate-binding protein